MVDTVTLSLLVTPGVSCSLGAEDVYGRPIARTLALIAVAGLLVGCSDAPSSPSTDPTTAVTATVSVTTIPTTTIPTTTATTTTTTTTTTLPTTTTTTSTTSMPALGGGTTPYVVPVDGAGWNPTHSGYPATDLFAACGAPIVSPVSGTVVHVRRVDSWDPAVDDPATRGGRSVAVVGLDGVRYYMAHLDVIDERIDVGVEVVAGGPIGTLGDTGRTSACHLHLGFSPPCPAPEWSVRRGVIWPAPYLDDWRAGGQTSPVAEIEQWLVDHPDDCVLAALDPHAAGSG